MITQHNCTNEPELTSVSVANTRRHYETMPQHASPPRNTAIASKSVPYATTCIPSRARSRDHTIFTDTDKGIVMASAAMIRKGIPP